MPKKVEDLQEELEKAVKLGEERLNDLKYLQADFENLKKSFDKEKEQLRRLAGEGLVRSLLPVLDDFDALLKSENGEGVRMIYDKFVNVLKSEGVVKVSESGVEFDSSVHEVVMVKQGDDDRVLEVLSPGYVFNSKTIRTAKVVVGKKEVKSDE